MTKYINLKVRLSQKEFEQAIWALGVAEFDSDYFTASEREKFKATMRVQAKLIKAYQEAN